MPDKPTAPDLIQADEWIDQLYASTHLAGGENLDVSETVNSLRQTKVQFGNPRDNLVALTESELHAAGIELTSIRKQQMQNEFDFYYMTITIDMRPKPGAHFQALACELNFGPKGDKEPIVQTIFPQTQWKEVMEFGGGMRLGLDGNLDWKVGVDATKLSALTKLPANVQAGLDNKNEMKSYIVLNDFSYDLGRFEIAAYGEGNSECYWFIQDADLQQSLTAKFGIVFKVPKGTDSITLQGMAWVEPKVSWLTANVSNIMGQLSEGFKKLFSRPDAVGQKLARGVGEKWTLSLPRQ